MKKKIIALLAVTSAVVFASFSLASQADKIDSLFLEMKGKYEKAEKLTADKKAPILAKDSQNKVKVMAEEFVKYKANKEFMSQMNGQKLAQSNQELLEEMLKNELVIEHALSLGVTVSEDELTSYINQEREILMDPNLDKNMKKILENLIKKSGLTEEEYWKSEETRELYKRNLITTKLALQLQINFEGYQKLANELYEKAELELDTESLNQL